MSRLPPIGGLPNAAPSAAGVGQKRPRPEDTNLQVPVPPPPHAAGQKSGWEFRLSNFVDNDGRVKPGNDIEGFIRLLDDAKDNENAVFCTEMLGSITESKLLSKLIKAGLLNPLREWLKEATTKSDTKWLADLLQASSE
jgi:hypothetical protein